MPCEGLYGPNGKKVGVVCFSDAVIFKHKGKKWICSFHRYFGPSLRDIHDNEIDPTPNWFWDWWKKKGYKKFPNTRECKDPDDHKKRKKKR